MAALASATTTAPASAVVPRVPIPAKGVDYRNKIVLAPMVRSGELPSRLLALKYGADLVWGPETIDKSMIGTERRVNPRNGVIEYTRMPSNGGRTQAPVKESIIYRIDPVREQNRLIFQMGTSNPELAVQAARVVAADVSGIDVNSGCPKPFSTHAGMGAALLRTPDLLVSILEALVKEVGEPFQIGISVKIRILSDPEETKKLVSRLVKTGITGLTVHCRTTPMRPRERAIRDQLRMVAGICHDAGVACVMNGDVTSRDQGLALMAEYGVDGAMIATSAETNSSCFRAEADGGLASWQEIVYEYMKICLEQENRMANTKYLLNMLIPGKNKEFKYATLSKTYLDLCRALKLEDLLPAAERVDQLLGLDEKWASPPGAPGATDIPAKPETKSKAVQNAMESESARAAGGGAARTKASAPVAHAGGPIRRTSAPKAAKVAKVEAEQPAVETTNPATQTQAQSQVTA
ncbi:Aldolase-type TIM barrel [Penicillium paradoxum]|uniref:Aldolase-type TIM barrel n=1 Tax=Penicillium paradoxum TaxID=176176 RepID=UPI002546AA67|nr:Aldolase-type TIM barrel [Penicillium paradoxum]KAJ5781008.1 Aldolase-type TIM barrel [Penicillium paradoxum]